MRRFLRLGDGLPLTVVTLLVCGPVLFGLALIFVEPFRDPDWIIELFRNPGAHPTILFWTLFFVRSVFSPWTRSATDDELKIAWGGLARASDLLWAVAAGVLLCLILVTDEETGATVRANIAAYIASALTIISIALLWRNRRDQAGFSRQR